MALSQAGDHLGRLFELLVNILAEQNPNKLATPFETAELYQKILPYKVHRRALGVDSHQDYEMALLRFLSGERGYATVSPSEVREALLQEVQAVDPNPGVLRDYAASKVKLNVEAVREVLNPHGAYAPPGTAFEPPPVPELEQASPEEPVEATAPAVPESPVQTRVMCPHCGGALPARRALYCPFCGGQSEMDACAKCGAGLESDWTFCAGCGHRVVGWDPGGSGG